LLTAGWGERTNSTPSRGYCANLGHPEDETGLVYMRARYYESGTGRFVSEDPARDGVNWYLYADGDAVLNADFDGQTYGGVAALWSALVIAITMPFGYAFGYLFAIWEIQTFCDSSYSPTIPSWMHFAFAGIQALTGFSATIAGNKVVIDYKFVHGYKRGVPGLIGALGFSGAIGFIFGFITGLTIGWFEYLLTT
jgi:RHS repeat-associated protein